jgi:cytosine deaminase
VTAAPRAVLGLPPARIAPGCPADLVALPGGDALEALGAASAHRTVWRSGRVVARTTVHAEISAPNFNWKEPPVGTLPRLEAGDSNYDARSVS